MGVSPRNYSPHIAESVRCVSLLLVSIVLFFFDVSVSYRIYYMYHGFSVYMANIRPEHRDIGPRRSRGPISRCEGLIFAIYPSKPWYIYYIYREKSIPMTALWCSSFRPETHQPIIVIMIIHSAYLLKDLVEL